MIIENKPSEIVGKITRDGVEVPFAKFIHEVATNELFSDYIEEILLAASDTTDRNEVADYISPIAKEVIDLAAKVDIEVYFDLIEQVRKAWYLLKCKEGMHV